MPGETHISTLIKNAGLLDREGLVDIRLKDGVISAIAAGIPPAANDGIIDARGGTLLPGLHDHHLHMLALAASLDSLRCGPPNVQSTDELAALLRAQNSDQGSGWVRGIAYHGCVAGDIDRDWLDRYIPDRPARIQHRGGRLWVLNSRALEELGVGHNNAPAGLETVDGRATGRLYEEDRWLRSRLASQFPDLSRASAMLASYGVTGITDTTPGNGTAEWHHFLLSQKCGQLMQMVRMMGSHSLLDCEENGLLQRGEFKIHLLESGLPEFDSLCREIEEAHARGRAVAIHCVTLTELVFAISALDTAGVKRGDRIEHASITSQDQLEDLQAMGLWVITQPHFIAERGDQYRAEVESHEQPWLYRGASFIRAGIPLAGGSDAPFGGPDPWRAMRAAVERKTPSGAVMDSVEALSPEQALSLFLSRPESPGGDTVILTAGRRADLCLLDSPWQLVRDDLSSQHVRSTWLAGKLTYGTP